MKIKYRIIIAIYSLVILASWSNMTIDWLIDKHNKYQIYYKSVDRENLKEYVNIIDKGIDSVQSFFKSSYKNPFIVNIHPDRKSLDSQWQKDWNMPDFKSECWMVASGVAAQLDMISPKFWDKESCEHKYSESIKMQKLLTHELVHVFHGQLNSSHDFSDVTGIDWFVEGLATYASGQCDSIAIEKVKNAISANKIPINLEKFWTGNLRYGLSGSVVLYIDNNYGREKLMELMKAKNLSEIFITLKTSEQVLIIDWKKYILQYKTN